MNLDVSAGMNQFGAAVLEDLKTKRMQRMMMGIRVILNRLFSKVGTLLSLLDATSST